MTTPPKTMEQICDSECDKHGYAMEKKYKQIELANMPSIIMDESFKAGFACRDKMDNEALKIAVEILEHKSKRSSYGWSDGGDYFPSDYANEGQLKCASEILAEIRKLRPEL